MKKILAVSLLTSLLCGGCALFGGDEGSSPATAAPAGDPATTETAKAPEKAPAKAAPVSQSKLEADLYKTGQSLVGRASRTEVRKGARGYVGFIRYAEHVYECRGASKSAALSAPCEKIKTRNLNEMIRYDGKKWQY